ncbi:endonuclease/exonuclease/phosphatase family protein [Nocardia farcinica]|uniref:endonuclease/exonuclease/phosphatase family protein n=1 Tax=Nocardia farcinica TaxID=37329 RepID=UPI001561EDEB|nr:MULTISPECIES: endonuclease/exonuclease/phosphatase family protein [Nocardia]MBF6187033.1 endonuclease/exonuclease/phosphatase family protein [Nocardia farcinica]UEX25664.1 endonuclease/exonuclease/phosphatase family protein [Nocardia farcinica]
MHDHLGLATVVTWNVQRAAVSRARRQLTWLLAVQPAVLVLTEVSGSQAGESTAQYLRDAGYCTYLPKAGADGYRVLVAARGTIDEVYTLDSPLAARFAAVQIDMPDRGRLAVIGMYVPSRGSAQRRNVDKRAYQDSVSSAIPGLVERLAIDQPCVAVGDLNVLEPDHHPRYRVFGEWEYDFYRSFGDNGMCDAFRLRNPGTWEYSWFGREQPDGSRNGYRFDHAFIDRAHASLVTNCTYVHEARTLGGSDHSALSLTILIGEKSEQYRM